MTRIDLLTNPMTTAEDIIVGGVSGAPTRLAKGSDGQVLTVDPTTHALVWADPAAAGSTGIGWIDDAGNPDVPPGSPSAQDDEFDAGSLDAKWTRTGTPGSQVFGSSRMSLFTPSAAEVSYDQAYAPGAGVAFTIAAKFTGCGFWEATDYYGIHASDAGGTKIAELDLRRDTTGLRIHNDVPTAAQTITIPGEAAASQQFYLRLARDASDNWTFAVSWGGLVYQSYTMASRSSSTTVAKVGFRFGQTAARSDKGGSIDWFRRT